MCESKASYPHLGSLLLLYCIKRKNNKKIENINQFIYNAIIYYKKYNLKL